MGTAMLSRRDYGYSTIRFENHGERISRSLPTELSVARKNLSATTVGDYALFAGVTDGYKSYHATVDVYDKNLARSTATELSVARCNFAATTVGDYALFGSGGSTSGYYYSTIVDAYYGILEVTMYKHSRYKFQNMSEELTVNSNMESISIPIPATGYIKFKNTTIL